MSQRRMFITTEDVMLTMQGVSAIQWRDIIITLIGVGDAMHDWHGGYHSAVRLFSTAYVGIHNN